ncbi:hypothetical protein [Terrisporobacter sp.]|uniref:hypothetical protein n=1 Tax=Terrisporobacter sp. TaxID=1965305 RepID=UPI00289D7E6F|nr:hypothetical protein [Terrisporobacter sp.]
MLENIDVRTRVKILDNLKCKLISRIIRNIEYDNTLLSSNDIANIITEYEKLEQEISNKN